MALEIMSQKKGFIVHVRRPSFEIIWDARINESYYLGISNLDNP